MSPAASTFALGQIAVGPATGNLDAPIDYPGRTPVVNANSVVNMPVNGSGNLASTGDVANAIINPTLTPSCTGGLSIGLVLDRSTSIDDSERSQYANAVRDLVNALVTPANNISITPIMFNSAATTGTSSIASSVLADSLRNTLAGSSGWAAATNWDAALRAAANGSYDVVLMVTDGAPTQSTGLSADSVKIVHIEQAVLSANAVKANGVPVLAVGVALPNNSVYNLQAISGKTAGVDYFTPQLWSDLSSQLTAIAQALICQVSIKVNKTTIDGNGTKVEKAEGWSFTASHAGDGSLIGDATQSTPANGSITWTQQFTAQNQSASVTLTEDSIPPGWQLSSVKCVNGNDTFTPTVSNNSWSLKDFTIGDSFVCTATNIETPTQLTLVKDFVGTHWGAPQDASAWTLKAGADTYTSGQTKGVSAGQYVLSEVGKSGFSTDYTVTCDGGSMSGKTLTIAGHTHVTCTFHNKDLPAHFTFFKYGTTQNALAGGSFQLYRESGAETGLQTSGSNADTAVGSPFAALVDGYTSPDLFWGDYYVYEVTPPTGYLAVGSGATDMFTLGAAETATAKVVSLTNVFAYKDLTVEKTAVPSYVSDYDWSITKQVDKTSAIVQPGQPAAFDYTLKATPSARKDSGFTVSGVITVSNPNSVTVTLTDVTDTLPSASCTVDKSAGLTVPANGSKTFAYTCTLSGADTSTHGTNTATATWSTTALPGTTGSDDGSKSFTFKDVPPATTTDASVVVSDTASEFAAKYTTPASRTAQATGGVKTFTYTRNLGAELTAGQCKTYDNTATISPTQPNVGAVSASQSVQVCTGSDLTVSKTVVESLHRTYAWSIEKAVDQTTRTVDENGKATFHYIVTATPGAYTDDTWAMSGVITVSNPNGWDVVGTVTDTPDFGANVSCTVVNGVAAVIPHNASKTFDYGCTFTGKPDYSGKNSATVTWDAVAAHTAHNTASGSSASVTEAQWNKTLTNETVTVVDDKTDPASPVTLGTATWTAAHTPVVFSYDLTITGPTAGSCQDYTNTASILETSQSDSVTVTVCNYADLTVTKSAATSFDRTYSFTIDKEAAETELQADPITHQATANYTVSVNGTATDSDFQVTGVITLKNPNASPVSVTSLTDAIAAQSCTLTQTLPFDVPAATKSGPGQKTVAYTCDRSDKTAGTNTVTAKWDTSELPGSSGTAVGHAGFTFDDASISDLNSKTITVVDDKTDPSADPVTLGQFTWSAQTPSKEFTYSLDLPGVAGDCVDYTNTAVFQTNRQQPSLSLLTVPGNSASETVTVCDYRDLTVTKSATPSFARDYDWSILKSVVGPDSAIVKPGSAASFGYQVVVTPSAAQDSGFIVSGSIAVTNPNAVAVTLTSLADSISLPASCQILPGQSLTVPSHSTLNYAYTCSLDSGSATSNGSNTATISWSLKGTSGGAASAPAAFDFATVTPSTTDASVTVSDTAPEFAQQNSGGTTVLATGGPKTFTYTRSLGAQVPAGECSDFPNTASIPATRDQSKLTSDADVNVCAPGGSVDKKVVSVTQNADKTWTVVYDVTVTNASTTGVALPYTLRDELNFGTGITPTSASVISAPAGVTPTPGWNGTSQLVLAAATLPANAQGTASHVYRIQVQATVDGSAQGAKLDCDERGDGGFRNDTGLFLGQTDTLLDSDKACAEPGSPTVKKTALAATPLADGTWQITYSIAVKNTTSIQLAYTLTDAPATLPAGASLVGQWSVTGPTPPQAGVTPTPGWNGTSQPQIATGVIAAGATHTYTVTGVVSFATDATDAAFDCTKNGGFINTATVTNGVATDDSTACSSVDRPGVNITKTVTSTTQAADGTWTVTYDVKVAHDGTGSGPATYDLSDQLKFGAGIQIQSASWAGVTSGSWASPFTQSAVLNTGKLLPAGSTDTYTVTVTATVPASVYGTTAADCTLQIGETGTGFLNQATVVSQGATKKADDCAQPEIPHIVKKALGAHQDATDPDVWHVVYEIDVTSGKYATFYSLTDDPGYPSGVTVIAGHAQRTTPSGTPFDIGEDLSFPSGPFAIAANTTQVWQVTWDVRIDGELPADLESCGRTYSAGHGFYNLAELFQGGTEIDQSDVCIPIADRVYPTVAKTVSSETQDPATGVWTVTYTITASLAPQGQANPEGLSAKYDLTDTLDFGAGITVLPGATWTSAGTPGGTFANNGTATLADDRVIAAGATHTYTVTVKATVAKSAITNGTDQCGGEQDGGGGFLNKVLLTTAGHPFPAQDCDEPVYPEIEKTGGTTTDNGDGTFGLSYDVTVTYPDNDADPEPTQIGYDLTDAPALPTGVQLVGQWTAAAVGGAPAPDSPTWDGSGTWKIVDDGALTPQDDSHTYRVTATVKVVGPPASQPATCRDTDSSGIVIPNVGTITSGAYTADDSGCQVVHWDDVSIQKTSSIEGGASVEPDQSFDYILTVTNNGTRAATDVVVTDILPARLQATAVQLPAGWTNDNAPDPVDDQNTLSVRTPSLAIGASVQIVVTVTFLPQDTSGDIPEILQGEPVPEPPTPVAELENTACVAAAVDGNAANNCDDIDIPTRDISALVYTRCVNDAPLLGWVITKSGNLVDNPINFLWTPNNPQPGTSPAQVALTQPGGTTTWADEIPWPGAVFTPSGVSIDYPGWRPLEASDYVPGGGYYIPGTTTVMTPADEQLMIFNGLILDPSELDYSWRFDSNVHFSVNPELDFTVTYPEATPACVAARHSDVQIEKDASVEITKPGGTFTYDLAVHNVSDDSAADGVVVTDAIPSDLKITDVTWAGKGDASVFPNWTTCEVTGQNGQGYGGTLTCNLFGPLQPVGAEGTSEAPTITLTAMVDPADKAASVTNTGVVNYFTFGHPEDPGSDADDDVVMLAALPATGGTIPFPILLTGVLALLTGGIVVVVSRRRRGDVGKR